MKSCRLTFGVFFLLLLSGQGLYAQLDWKNIIDTALNPEITDSFYLNKVIRTRSGFDVTLHNARIVSKKKGYKIPAGYEDWYVYILKVKRVDVMGVRLEQPTIPTYRDGRRPPGLPGGVDTTKKKCKLAFWKKNKKEKDGTAAFADTSGGKLADAVASADSTTTADSTLSRKEKRQLEKKRNKEAEDQAAIEELAKMDPTMLDSIDPSMSIDDKIKLQKQQMKDKEKLQKQIERQEKLERKEEKRQEKQKKKSAFKQKRKVMGFFPAWWQRLFGKKDKEKKKDPEEGMELGPENIFERTDFSKVNTNAPPPDTSDLVAQRLREQAERERRKQERVEKEQMEELERLRKQIVDEPMWLYVPIVSKKKKLRKKDLPRELELHAMFLKAVIDRTDSIKYFKEDMEKALNAIDSAKTSGVARDYVDKTGNNTGATPEMLDSLYFTYRQANQKYQVYKDFKAAKRKKKKLMQYFLGPHVTTRNLKYNIIPMPYGLPKYINPEDTAQASEDTPDAEGKTDKTKLEKPGFFKRLFGGGGGGGGGRNKSKGNNNEPVQQEQIQQIQPMQDDEPKRRRRRRDKEEPPASSSGLPN